MNDERPDSQEAPDAGVEGHSGAAGPAPEAPSTATPVPPARPGVVVRARRAARDLFVTVALVGAAFVVGLLLFNFAIMPRFVHHTAVVRVPDLVNLTYEQAEQLAVRGEVTLSRAGERFDPGVERGRIVQQDPLPGTPVRGRVRIAVVVSLGEEFSSVPALHGEPRRSAELLLERAGLVRGGVTRVPSDDEPEGAVIATDPPAETVLPRGGRVALLVSSGPGEQAFAMPDLVGREITRVTRQLEGQGFTVIVASSAVGPIVSQEPAPGARLTRAETITLRAGSRVIR